MLITLTHKRVAILILLVSTVLTSHLTLADAVAQQDDALPQIEGPYYVEAEVDIPNPYLGQQIVYTFRLYQTSMFLGEAVYEDPPFTDFWSQTVISKPTYTQQIEGQNYLVTEVKTALFPATLGEVTIGPSRLLIRGNVFSNETFQTNSVTVQVRSLPSNAPDSFRGAVGQYTITAETDAATGKVNEPVAFRILVEGFGNIRLLNEPLLPDLPDWRIFNSTLSTELDTRDGSVYGTRLFERLILPTQAGDYILPAIEFTYFDPLSETYETIYTDPIPITVAPLDRALAEDFAPYNPNEPEIRQIKPVPTAFTSPTASLMNDVWYWVCWLIPALVVGGGWGIKKWWSQRAADVDGQRRKQAYKKATQQLKSLQIDSDEAPSTLHRILSDYLTSKLNRPIAGLTKAQLRQLLVENKISATLAHQVETTFSQIGTSRFAPPSVSNTQTLINDVKELLKNLEKSLP